MSRYGNSIVHEYVGLGVGGRRVLGSDDATFRHCYGGHEAACSLHWKRKRACTHTFDLLRGKKGEVWSTRQPACKMRHIGT